MKTILVIEDSEVMRENIVEILELNDYTVLQAENGLEGVRFAVTYKPDLVICDITMPKINGFEVFSQLKKIPVTKHTPFIFLSAIAEKSIQDEDRLESAEVYLAKPFHSDQLLKAVEECLQ